MKNCKRKMLHVIKISFLFFFLTVSLAAQTNNTLDKNIPHLKKQGTATQLIVGGKPFLILGGEFGNSSFTSLEYILTPFSEENLQADLKAFQALMKHVKEIDKNEHTIIMIQPENEIGMLPTARDYHPLANKKFQEDVPPEFIKYFKKNKGKLVPEFKDVWAKNGYKESGSWEEIFGNGLHTDEIFMAWYYSKFTNTIVEAGKVIYPLPMFVNAALNRPGRSPGEGYPSAGPLPHLMDIWKAGGPSIDFLSPDFYFPNIKHWSDLYTRQENPLFIPEHRFDSTAAAKAAFVFGHYEAIGFSPFSIESTR